jgi:hypothetical protein
MNGKREIAALKAASRELERDIAIPCTLLTMDKEEEMDIPGFFSPELES